MKFGEILGQLMTKYRLSQAALANAVGINRSTIKRYLNGDIQDMKVDRVLAMATAMKMSDSDRNALLKAAGYTSTIFLLSNDAEAQSKLKAEIDSLRQKGEQLEQEKQELAQQLSQRHNETTNISTSNTPIDVSSHQRLQNAYIKPSEVFERTSRFRFTGREWLLAKIDQFLEENDRGYFVLEANAGLGKTAFLAWLVQERKYIHHFCELNPGVNGITDGLKSIAAQLAIKYGLDTDKLLYTEPSRSDYLYIFLNEIAQQQGNGEKVVIVVDALDESEALGNGNVMGLPTGLPKGVYFIVSQRPTTVRLSIKDPTTTACAYFELVAESEANQADMLSFLEYASTLPEIRTAFQQSKQQYMPEQFITTLKDKCRGVWIYLYFVVQEISNGDRSPLDLNALPDGMTAYYAHHWWRLRAENYQRWEKVYLPILTMLAAAQEAVSCQKLIEWSGADISERGLKRLLGEQWLPFMSVSGSGLQARYRFYHATLQEFFDGKLDATGLSTTGIAVTEELSDETRAAHNRLVERYLMAWGGFDTNLEGLKVKKLRELDDGYGLHHLATHLEASGRGDDLHKLLKIEWVHSEHVVNTTSDSDQIYEENQFSQGASAQNVWYTVREAAGQVAGYITDVNRAWHLTERIIYDKKETDFWSPERIGTNLGLQCRYALIVSSIISQVNNVSLDLMIELVKKGIWTYDQCLTYIRQRNNRNDQVEMLVGLVPYLPEKMQPKIIQEALRLAPHSNLDKAGLGLAPYLSRDQIQEALGEASNNRNAIWLPTLSKLAPYFSKEQLREAVSLACKVWTPYQSDVISILAPYLALEQIHETLSVLYSDIFTTNRAKALASLVNHIAELGQLEQAINIAQTIKNEFSKVDALVNLMSYLTLDQLQEMLSMTKNIKSIRYRGKFLAHLVQYIAALGQCEQAITIAFSIEDDYFKILAFKRLIASCSLKLQEDISLFVISIVDSLSKAEAYRVEALVNLIPNPSAEQFKEILALISLIKIDSYQTRLLSEIAPNLSSDQLNEALEFANSLESADSRYHALSSLAPYLSPDQLKKLLSLVRAIKDEPTSLATLVCLTCRMGELGHPEQALSLIPSFKDESSQAHALSKLAPYLLPEQLQRALSMAGQIVDGVARMEILINIVSYLSPEHQQQAVLLAYSIKDKAQMGESFTSFAIRMGELGQPKQALSLISIISDNRIRSKALIQLAPHLSHDELNDALLLAQDLYHQRVLLDVLSALASHLSKEQLEKAFSQALSSESDSDHTDALYRMVPFLAPAQLQELLSLVGTSKCRMALDLILARMAPYLSQDQLLEASLKALSIKESSQKAHALGKLAPHMSPELLQEIFLKVLLIEDELSRLAALVKLIPYLTQEQRHEAIEMLQPPSITKKGETLLFIIFDLAMQLPDYALKFALTLKEDGLRCRALSKLAPTLSSQQLDEAFSLLQLLDSSSHHFAESLVDLLPYLRQDQLAKVLSRGYSYTSIYNRIAEAGLMSQLSLEQQEEALATLFQNERNYSNLDILIPHLTEYPQTNLHYLWQNELHNRSNSVRSSLLRDLNTFSGLIAYLGGISAITETAQAIQDVGRWWQ